VEEQLYLVWPWLVLLLAWLAARRHLTPRSRLWLAAATLVLAAVSAVLMAALPARLRPDARLRGTNTRAFGLLIGAAVAIAWPTRGPVPARDGATRAGTARADTGRVVPAGVRRLLDAAGIAGLAVIGLLVWRTNEYSGFMFRGGLVLLSAATAAVAAGTVAVAAASWRLVEGPVRRGTRLPRIIPGAPRQAVVRRAVRRAAPGSGPGPSAARFALCGRAMPAHRGRARRRSDRGHAADLERRALRGDS
jgi:peptidoglycan/LPS O-acetylase OafA/YrhL